MSKKYIKVPAICITRPIIHSISSNVASEINIPITSITIENNCYIILKAE